MEKLFIVSVDTDALKDHRDAFTSFLRSDHPKAGFWHHIAHAWLIIDPDGRLTAAKLRDKMRELSPSANSVVIEIKPLDYASFGPPDANKWLRDYIVSTRWKDR